MDNDLIEYLGWVYTFFIFLKVFLSADSISFCLVGHYHHSFERGLTKTTSMATTPWVYIRKEFVVCLFLQLSLFIR